MIVAQDNGRRRAEQRCHDAGASRKRSRYAPAATFTVSSMPSAFIGQTFGRFNIHRLRAFVAAAQQHDDDRAMAIDAVADGAVDAVAFGVPFIANPDLPERLKRDAPLNAANPKTFYSASPEGYTDYPTLM